MLQSAHADADERVLGVEFSNDALSVSLRDGRVISVPLAWYPRLLSATPSQRNNWKIAVEATGFTGPTSTRTSAPKDCCAARPRRRLTLRRSDRPTSRAKNAREMGSPS